MVFLNSFLMIALLISSYDYPESEISSSISCQHTLWCVILILYQAVGKMIGGVKCRKQKIKS